MTIITTREQFNKAADELMERCMWPPTSTVDKPLNFLANELVEAAHFILDRDDSRTAHVAAVRLIKNAITIYPKIRREKRFIDWATRFGRTLQTETREEHEQLNEVLKEVERGYRHADREAVFTAKFV